MEEECKSSKMSLRTRRRSRTCTYCDPRDTCIYDSVLGTCASDDIHRHPCSSDPGTQCGSSDDHPTFTCVTANSALFPDTRTRSPCLCASGTDRQGGDVKAALAADDGPKSLVIDPVVDHEVRQRWASQAQPEQTNVVAFRADGQAQPQRRPRRAYV